MKKYQISNIQDQHDLQQIEKGFPIQRIQQQKIAQSLECPICLELVRDPYCCPNQHSICKVCYGDLRFKKCPICIKHFRKNNLLNQPLKKLIAEVYTISCKYSNYGCTTNIECDSEKVELHEQKCLYGIQALKNYCLFDKCQEVKENQLFQIIKLTEQIQQLREEQNLKDKEMKKLEIENQKLHSQLTQFILEKKNCFKQYKEETQNKLNQEWTFKKKNFLECLSINAECQAGIQTQDAQIQSEEIKKYENESNIENDEEYELIKEKPTKQDTDNINEQGNEGKKEEQHFKFVDCYQVAKNEEEDQQDDLKKCNENLELPQKSEKLIICDICGRVFCENVIQKHQLTCKNQGGFHLKRPKFESSKQRKYQ